MVQLDKLIPGINVKSTKWKEPIEIVKIEELGDYVRVVGFELYSNAPVNQVIPKEELKEISIESLEIDFSGDPQKVFLAFEAIRYRFASLYDPLLALNTSKVDPLPHQIEAVYGYHEASERIAQRWMETQRYYIYTSFISSQLL